MASWRGGEAGRHAANTAWLFLDKGVGAILGLLVGAYVARYLGPDRLGSLAYAMSIVAIVSPLARLGLDRVIVTELVISPASRDALLGTAFGLRLVWSILLLSLLLGAAWTFETAFGRAILLVLALSLPVDALNIVGLYFQATVQAKQNALASMAAGLLTGAFRVCLVLGKAGLLWFAAAEVLGRFVLGAACLCRYWRQRLTLRNWSMGFARSRHLLKRGAPLMVSAAAVAIYMRVDQVMLRWMQGDRALGQYAVAVRLCEALCAVSALLSQSLTPFVLSARASSGATYRARLQGLHTGLIWLTVGMSLAVSFFARELVQVLFGPDFQLASEVVQIYVWSSVFVAVGGISSIWLVAEGLEYLSLLRTVIGCVCNILLNLWLIPVWGGQGAAVSTVISYGVAALGITALMPVSRPIASMPFKALVFAGLRRGDWLSHA